MAVTNQIILIAPQSKDATGYQGKKSNKCWDGSGYTGENFAFRYGLQPMTFMNMFNHVIDCCSNGTKV